MDKSQLVSLLETCNQRQAAEQLGVHIATVKRAIKRFGIVYEKKSGGHPAYRDNPLPEGIELTQEQNDLIIGSLLGDGYMLKDGTFRMKQKSSRREYVDFLHDRLDPFALDVRLEKSRKPTRINGKISHRIEDWNGEWCHSVMFYTRKHQIFDSFRETWYPKGEKIVPEGLALNHRILTHWYLQDGSYSPKFGMVRLSCQSFNKNDIVRLVGLLDDMGIKSEIAKNQSYDVIDIYDDHLKFQSLIGHRPSCFSYKFSSMSA